MDDLTPPHWGAGFDKNEDGVWCPSCGENVVPPWFDNFDDEDEWPEECPTCGYPDDSEKMTEYFT